MAEEPAQAEPAAAADSPLPGRRPRPISNLRRRLLIAAAVIPNLTVLAVFFSPVFRYIFSFLVRSPFIGLAAVALIFSQGALVAFWVVFGSGRPLWRSLAVVLGVVANTWVQQHRQSDFIQYLAQHRAIPLLCAVWGFLVVARVLGLGLVRTPDARRTLQPLQFSIADMLLWTTALAVVLGLLRWLALDWHRVLGDMDRRGEWAFFVALALVAMAATFLALGRGRPLLRVLLLPLSLVACVGVMEAVCFIAGQPFSSPRLSSDACGVSLMAGWLVGSLWMLRLAGYRLAWPWRFRRESKPR